MSAPHTQGRAIHCANVYAKGCPAMNTAAFQHWRGGARWHHRQGGYFGHLVQVVDDFGSLVAVRGRLRRTAVAEITGRAS
ncbi:hypothetical protein ACQ858_19675 [Variovorax ureilyticus]|uniref:hypothetical protein n=1 Tax=Variovorax ureilyticus TaxID=1836198 RepID=UPI003D672B89